MRFCRKLFLFAAVMALAIPCASFAQSKTLGTIERLDPKFDDLVAKDATIEMLVEKAFKWSEGPVWSKEHKAVLFSDIPRNKIWSWSPEKGLETFLERSGYSGKSDFTGKEPGSNGLTIDAKGRLILCQHGDRQIAAYDEKAKKFEVLASKYQGKRFNSPNDLIIMKNGDILFTDPPYGLPKGVEDPARELDFQGVYRLSKGEVTLLTKEMTRPNGLALSPDEKTLYVANSDPKIANWMSFPMKADGTLGAGKVFFDVTPLAGNKPGLPDGMKVDTQGNLWATGPGGIFVFTAAGKHLGTLATGVPTANCNWGDDGGTLYITANDNLVRVKTKVKGW